jgi:hypothetical protein
MANAQLQVKFTTNRLGTQNLVYNGFKFQAKNRQGDRLCWTKNILWNVLNVKIMF